MHLEALNESPPRQAEENSITLSELQYPVMDPEVALAAAREIGRRGTFAISVSNYRIRGSTFSRNTQIRGYRVMQVISLNPL